MKLNGSRASHGRRMMGWGAALCSLGMLVGPPATLRVDASDHIDAPLTSAFPAVDIGDFYAWITDDGTIATVLTFNAGLGGGELGEYDPEVLYTIHIDNTANATESLDVYDNDNDNASDIQIHVRFGQAPSGNWGVQFSNIPGADDETLVGPVETVLSSGSATAMAGVFDDPFFFDFDGYAGTIMNMLDDADPSDIVFSSLAAGASVDTFAGSNTMAIVVEFDADVALDGNPDSLLQLWATTGRL